MSKRIECFTVYWNEEVDKVTIKITPEFKADPIMMYYGLEQIMSELEKIAKKNFKKAEKAGLDLHLGCDAWPECDESPGGCDHYNASFSDLIQRDKFKFLHEGELAAYSALATNMLRSQAHQEGREISLDEFRVVAVTAIQDRLKELNKNETD
jgi:hypothetical protein